MTNYILIYFWHYDDKQVTFENNANIINLIDRAENDIRIFPGIEKIEIYEIINGIGDKQFYIKKISDSEVKRWYNIPPFDPEEVK